MMSCFLPNCVTTQVNMPAEMELINASGFHGEGSIAKIEIAMLSFCVEIESWKRDELIISSSIIDSRNWKDWHNICRILDLRIYI